MRRTETFCICCGLVCLRASSGPEQSLPSFQDWQSLGCCLGSCLQLGLSSAVGSGLPWTHSQAPGAESCFPAELPVVLPCSVSPSSSRGRQHLPEGGLTSGGG